MISHESFTKKYNFYDIALLFFILSADHIDISTIGGVWEKDIIEQLSLKLKTGRLSQYYL